VLKVANFDGRLRGYDAGLEFKAGQRALCVMRSRGHPKAELLKQRIWKGNFSGKVQSREFDAIVIGEHCALVVEVAVKASLKKAVQLLVGLKFLRCAPRITLRSQYFSHCHSRSAAISY
jgi:hypothetical protein